MLAGCQGQASRPMRLAGSRFRVLPCPVHAARARPGLSPVAALICRSEIKAKGEMEREGERRMRSRGLVLPLSRDACSPSPSHARSLPRSLPLSLFSFFPTPVPPPPFPPSPLSALSSPPSPPSPSLVIYPDFPLDLTGFSRGSTCPVFSYQDAGFSKFRST